jgi:membrane protein implicated in regulation of membrane protease activity
MIVRFFSELGPWNWMALGFVLLILEVFLPGVFLLWIGLAALIVGGLSLMFWHAGFWVWQVQVVLFLALSLACALAGK